MKTKFFLFISAMMVCFETMMATEPSTITVAQALTIGEALSFGATSSEEYIIEGYIVGTEEYNSTYKNQNFWMVDEIGSTTFPLYVYRGKSASVLSYGQKVQLHTKLQNYGNEYNHVIEALNPPLTILDNTELTADQTFSGVCGKEGDNLTWRLNLHTGQLDIEGSGEMMDSTKNLLWHQQNMKYCIRKVTLPQDLKTIGLSAFDNCALLESVVIPENVNTIGKWAFYNCKSLTSLNLPDSVRLIGVQAFVGCALTEPLYNAQMFCFLPTDYSGVYTVPDGIVSVISYAFDARTNLTGVVLPSSLKRIGYRTFRKCTGLQSITCKAVEPPTSNGGESFVDVDKSIPIYVPENSIEAYKEADEWKEFANIVKMDTPEGIDEINSSANLGGSRKLIHDGQLLILRGDKTYTITGQEVK